MTDKPTIAPLRADHRDAALRVWQELWRGGRRANAAYFKWKFVDNPARVEQPVQAATFRGEVVGLLTVQGARWELSGDQYLAPCIGDLLVVKAHRGSSVFHDLLNASVEAQTANGNTTLFDLTSGPYVAAMLMQGWRTAGALTEAHIDNRHGRRLLERSLAVGARLCRVDEFQERAGWRRPWPDPFRRLAGRHDIEVDDRPRPPEMADLVARLGPSACLRGVRDEAFFRWRFENPLARYQFLYLGDGSLDGYLVLGLNRPTSSKGQVVVVDLVASSDEIADALLDCAVRARFRMLSAWPGENESDHRRYEALGFEIDRPTGHPIKDIERPMILMKQAEARAGESASLGSVPIGSLEKWDPSPIFFDDD